MNFIIFKIRQYVYNDYLINNYYIGTKQFFTYFLSTRTRFKQMHVYNSIFLTFCEGIQENYR